MLKKVLQSWRWWILTVAFLVVFSGAISGSQEFQSCVNSEYNAHPEYDALKYPKHVLTALKVYGGCWMGFLATTEGEGLITAFATLAVAIFTGTLWGATTEQARITNGTLETMRDAERAYVKLSHTAPGIEFEGGLDSRTEEFFVTVEIINSGRTPAHVTNVFFRFAVLPNAAHLPAEPDYSGEGTSEDSVFAFLVANDRVYHRGRLMKLPPADFQPVIEGERQLYIIGYVDYIDAYRRRYRGGYARVYDAGIDAKRYVTVEERAKRNNLLFVTQSGYNYDRPRRPGQGNDWNQ